MTTFQAIIYAVIQGFSGFLPISSDAHRVLVPYFTHWPAPAGPFAGALALGSFLAVLIYFRHDWASIVSCFLQVIIFRKRPMTLDERLPIFIAIATLPLGIACRFFLEDRFLQPGWTPLAVAAALAGFGVPLWLADSMSRKNKSMFDWNWLDSAIVGILQLGTLVVGFGSMTATLVAALFRNYNREAAAKFAFFTLAPILAVEAFHGLHGIDIHAPSPTLDMTWLSFIVAIIVTLFASLLAIGGLMKQIQHKGFAQYVAYRWVVAIATVALYWYRTRS